MEVAMLKRVRVLILTLALAFGAILTTTTPAHAVTYIWICNNPSSDDYILAYRTQSPFIENMIRPGICVQFNDTNGAAKVDVDPEGTSFATDIDKYRRNKAFGPWESWNCNENPASDPYSGTNVTTEYWTSKYSC